MSSKGSVNTFTKKSHERGEAPRELTTKELEEIQSYGRAD